MPYVLESLTTFQKKCQIVYHNETDELVETQGKIVDIYAANKADFLKLDDGTEIRLDKIVSSTDAMVSLYSA